MQILCNFLKILLPMLVVSTRKNHYKPTNVSFSGALQKPHSCSVGDKHNPSLNRTHTFSHTLWFIHVWKNIETEQQYQTQQLTAINRIKRLNKQRLAHIILSVYSVVLTSYHVQCIRKVFTALTFSTFHYVTALFQNGFNYFFSSKFYTKYPIMTTWKKVFQNV